MNSDPVGSERTTILVTAHETAVAHSSEKKRSFGGLAAESPNTVGGEYAAAHVLVPGFQG